MSYKCSVAYQKSSTTYLLTQLIITASWLVVMISWNLNLIALCRRMNTIEFCYTLGWRLAPASAILSHYRFFTWPLCRERTNQKRTLPGATNLPSVQEDLGTVVVNLLDRKINFKFIKNDRPVISLWNSLNDVLVSRTPDRYTLISLY